MKLPERTRSLCYILLNFINDSAKTVTSKSDALPGMTLSVVSVMGDYLSQKWLAVAL